MSDKLMSIVVQGEEHEWSFTFYGNPDHMEDWIDDGLEVYLVENVIPLWIWNAGLERPWCFLQDLFNFKNPFAK